MTSETADSLRQLERLFQILYLVQSRPPNAPMRRRELAKACGCSVRTIQRAITLLRDGAGIDIQPDRGEGAYVLPEKGVPFFAPAFDLTDTFALAFAGSLIGGSASLPQRETMLTALNKVRDMFRPPLRGLFEEASLSIGLAELPRDYGAAPIPLLLKACQEHRTVLMDYSSYSGRGRTRRKVDPYLVEARAGIFWEVHGWCHENRAIRTFALDRRLHEATLTDEPFIRRESEWEVFQKTRGVGGLRGGESIEVDVLFSAEAAPYALIHQWPACLTVSETGDGLFLGARLTGHITGGLDALVPELLRWRRHAEVIGGPALRDRIIDEIGTMAALYRPNPPTDSPPIDS